MFLLAPFWLGLAFGLVAVCWLVWSFWTYIRPAPRFQASLLVRSYNGLAGCVRLGPTRPFSEEALLAAATAAVGGDLYDFGDASHRTGLRALLTAFNTADNLSPFGAMIARESLVRLLAQRLLLQEIWRCSTESIDRLEAVSPMRTVVVVGLARTGTTLLQRLLAGAAGALPRTAGKCIGGGTTTALLSWEAMYCAGGRRQSRWWRRLRAQASAQALGWFSPVLNSIHPVDPDAPEEELLLLDLSFASQTWEALFPVAHAYTPWLESAAGRKAARSAYSYMRRVLLTIRHQRASASVPAADAVSRGQNWWVLKTPNHFEFPDALAEAFPNAVYVRTHRPLTQCLPSLCSMACHLQAMTSKQVDARRVAAHWMYKVRRMLALWSRFVAQRKPPMVDVQFADLMRDPAAVVTESICSPFHIPLRHQDLEQTIDLHVVRRRDGSAAHRYSLADFGLKPSDVSRYFRACGHAL